MKQKAEGSKIRILVVVDVRLYREGLAGALANRTVFESVMAISSREDIFRAAEKYRPDVILTDMLVAEHLPEIRSLTRRWPCLKIVAFGVKDHENDILSWASVGAQGLVPPDASIDELIEVVFSSIRGEFCCSSRAMAALARYIAATSPESIDGQNGFRLTAREREIVRCLGAGQSNKEIARELEIQVSTVKNHVHHVLVKLGVKRRAEAVACLHETGWFAGNIEPPRRFESNR